MKPAIGAVEQWKWKLRDGTWSLVAGRVLCRWWPAIDQSVPPEAERISAIPAHDAEDAAREAALAEKRGLVRDLTTALENRNREAAALRDALRQCVEALEKAPVRCAGEGYCAHMTRTVDDICDGCRFADTRSAALARVRGLTEAKP